MDAISMLKDDHKTVERLFRRFETAGPRAYAEKRDIVDRLIEACSVHAAIEEQLFYPVARATVPGTEDIALESLEEHHIVKWVLSELETMNPEHERFDAKVTVLIENVRHHVKEEETNFFPMVRGELGRTALRDLGDAMAKARKLAPTNPHPRSADEPPCNTLVGPAAGVADRIGDTVSGLAQGGVTAVGGIIAMVLGRSKPRVSPNGSTVARKAATSVRTGASDVRDAGVAAAHTAKRTTKSGRKTGSSAASRAKRPSNKRRVTGASARAKTKPNSRATTARQSTKRAAATTTRKTTTTKATARRSARRMSSRTKAA